jgi:hypothetical protein
MPIRPAGWFAVVVDRDEATLVQRQAHFVGGQAVGVRGTADRDDQLVEHGGVGFALGVVVFHGDVVVALGDFADLAAQVDAQALLGEQLVGFLGDLLVHGAQEGRRPSSTVTSEPRRRHTEPISRPITPAPITPSFRHVADGQCAFVRQDQFFIELCARQCTGVGAGGDDDLLADDGFVGRRRHGQRVALR